MSLFLCLATLAAPPAAAPDIVVTAALSPVPTAVAPASITLFDAARIEALGAPFATDLLRLTPGVAVATSGGSGAQAQVRIRGGEANHTLLFIDGIAFDDVAADDQARFETLGTTGLSRIEVVRGPQSALWGSEALGGVVALVTADPLGPRGATLSAEHGSLSDTQGAFSLVSGGESAGIAASGAYGHGNGIDVLGGGTGDRDGYANVTATLKAVARPGSDGEFGLVGRFVRHENDYDGVGPDFLRADTRDSSTAETWAMRGWARIGREADAPWSLLLDGQHLDSANRNRDADAPVNASFGRRTRIGGTATHRFAAGGTQHGVDVRIEFEDETFRTRNLQSGAPAEDGRRLTRGRTAYVAEWRGQWGAGITTDIAVRHDDFSRFQDSTTVRAHAIVPLVAGVSLVGGYGEGLAQPGFAELFGFSANSGFVGNLALTPERSRGYEVGMRLASGAVTAEIAAFSNRLTDEIVYADLPGFRYTYANAGGRSRRRGIEVSAEARPLPALRITASYTFLDAREPRSASEARPPQEIRRPRHAGNVAAEWRSGQVTVGGALAYVGKRRDIDFDSFVPAVLDDYLLASGRIAVRITGSAELFGRIENGFDARYQDVVGYATAGRTVHAGVRVRI